MHAVHRRCYGRMTVAATSTLPLKANTRTRTCNSSMDGNVHINSWQTPLKHLQDALRLCQFRCDGDLSSWKD